MSQNPSKRRRRRVFLATGFLLVMGIAAFGLWYHLARKGPAAIYDNPEEHFKYGALGLKQGFPYYLWTVMPEVFPELLPAPGGWEVFGFIDEGRGYPVGFALQTVGFPALSPNCALCHTGSYQTPETPQPIVVPGAPAGSLDFGAFNDFVFAAADDPRFDADVLIPAIEGHFDLTWSERLIYRYVLLPTVRKTLKQQQADAAWLTTRPPGGRGRFDAFNLFKISVLGLPDDGSIGTSDFPPLFNQGARQGQYLHWNGSGNDIAQDNLMSAYPLNLGPSGFLPDSLHKVTAYLRDLPPPPYPLAIDRQLAQRGQPVFDTHCASCHAFGGDAVGQVTPQQELGTDPAFLAMWSEAFVERLGAIDEPPFKFPGLRRTDGYLNVPLDGIWIRAPYLHNGSVPSLEALLAAPAERPAVFHRGSPWLATEGVGFAATEAAAGTFRFDTSIAGNTNAGHIYGTDLSPDDKLVLIEYLKTL